MLRWIVGVALVLAGIAGTANALGVVRRVTRLWPREYGRGDAGLFASALFLMRFVSLMLSVAGLAVLWLAAFGTN
jgi:hypothetical protein